MHVYWRTAPLLALGLSFCLSITTISVEATKQQLPEDQLECDPDVEESCVTLQTVTNDSSSSARESSDADQTRPSDSIRDKVEDEIQVDQSGGKNVPDPPKLDDSMYNVRVTIMGIHINEIHEDDNDFTPQLPHGTDFNHDGGEFRLVVYVQGQGHTILPDNHQYAGEAYTLNQKFDIKLPKNLPLSIMTVGYEKDACPAYTFPQDIKQRVIDRLAPLDRDSLLRLQKSFNDQINSLCGPNDEKHDAIGYIHKLYQWTSIDAEPNFDSITAASHFEEVEDSIGIPNAPDFQLTYQIDVTAPSTNEIKK